MVRRHAFAAILRQHRIREHRLWPQRSASVLAAAVAITEVGLALAVGVTGLVPGNDFLAGHFRPVMAGVGVLFLMYTGYAALLVRQPETPCGCGVGQSPASAFVVVRAAALAGIAAALLAYGAQPEGLGATPVETMLAVEAGLALAVIALVLPDSLSEISLQQ